MQSANKMCVALIIWCYDAQTIALSYPQSFISRFEEGVDEIVVAKGFAQHAQVLIEIAVG